MRAHVWSAALLAGLALAPPSPAAAQPLPQPPTLSAQERANENPLDGDMRFFVARSASVGCPTDCAAWIVAEGGLIEATANKFNAFLKKIGPRKLPVLVNSRGGSVRAALAMGRMIRARGLDVAVAKTIYIPCVNGKISCGDIGAEELRGDASGDGATCASACAFLLAAGQRRMAPPGAMVGVHQILTRRIIVTRRQTFRDTIIRHGGRVETLRTILSESRSSRTEKRVETTASTKALVGPFLRDMGVSPQLIEWMDTAPPSGIRELWRAELLQSALVTDEMSVRELLGAPAPIVSGGAQASVSVPMRANGVGDFEPTPFNLVSQSGERGVAILVAPPRSVKSLAMQFRPGLFAWNSVSLMSPGKAEAGVLRGPAMLAMPRRDLCALRRSAAIRLNFGATMRGTRFFGMPYQVDARRLFAASGFFDNTCI